MCGAMADREGSVSLLEAAKGRARERVACSRMDRVTYRLYEMELMRV